MDVISLEEAQQHIKKLQKRSLIVALQEGDEWTLSLTGAGLDLALEWREARHNQFAEERYSFTDKLAKLKELRIAGFKCFKSAQSLNFCREGEDHPAKWTVIVGENGVGKTTILKLVAALYPQYRPHVKHGELEILADGADFALPVLSSSNVSGDTAEVECRYEVDVGKGFAPIITRAHSLGEERRGAFADELLVELSSVTYTTTKFGLGVAVGHSEYLARAPLVAAYGASRYIGEARLAGSDDASAAGVRSLFEDDVPLKNPEEWLLQADYTARFSPKRNGVAKRRLERIKRALTQLLPGVSKVTVAAPENGRESPHVLFHTPFGAVDLPSLSFGYQSTIAWVVDFATRLFEYYPDLDNPLTGQGMVLLDEIDLHAHPKWQRSLMSFLEHVFPNVNFIVTTHSPVVLQGSRRVNLILLKRFRDEVRVVNDLDELSEWRVDQILTSDLFGLASAAPDYVAKIEKRRIKLLEQDSLSDDDKRELQDIEQTLARIPLTSDPASDKARALILDYAARMAG